MFVEDTSAHPFVVFLVSFLMAVAAALSGGACLWLRRVRIVREQQRLEAHHLQRAIQQSIISHERDQQRATQQVLRHSSLDALTPSSLERLNIARSPIMLRKKKDLNDESLNSSPFLKKRVIFEAAIQQRHAPPSLLVAASFSLSLPPPPPLLLRVERGEKFFQESLAYVTSVSDEEWRRPLCVTFRGEEGKDDGGLTRHWFYLIGREMCSPDRFLLKRSEGALSVAETNKSGGEMWKYVFHPWRIATTSKNNESLHLEKGVGVSDWNSEDDVAASENRKEKEEKDVNDDAYWIETFAFIGRVFAKAMYEGYMLPIHLSPALLKSVLARHNQEDHNNTKNDIPSTPPHPIAALRSSQIAPKNTRSPSPSSDPPPPPPQSRTESGGGGERKEEGQQHDENIAVAAAGGGGGEAVSDYGEGGGEERMKKDLMGGRGEESVIQSLSGEGDKSSAMYNRSGGNNNHASVDNNSSNNNNNNSSSEEPKADDVNTGKKESSCENKKDLNFDVDLNDLAELDMRYAASLQWLLDNDIDGMDLNLFFDLQDEEAFEIPSAVPSPARLSTQPEQVRVGDVHLHVADDVARKFEGRPISRELVPGGSLIPVTNANKEDYVRRICRAKLIDGVTAQIEAFTSAFVTLIPPPLLRGWSKAELDLLLTGHPPLSVAEWRKETVYKAGYSDTSQVIQWLWEIVDAWNDENKARFLQFVTGFNMLPPEGFKGLMGSNGPRAFHIIRVQDISRLPQASTCFNELFLPPYESKELLESRLITALNEGGEHFGWR